MTSLPFRVGNRRCRSGSSTSALQYFVGEHKLRRDENRIICSSLALCATFTTVPSFEGVLSATQRIQKKDGGSPPKADSAGMSLAWHCMALQWVQYQGID